MHKSIRTRLAALTLGVAALALSGWVLADPPTRVARLGYMSGAVSFSPAGENEWVHGAVNRPLTSGDRLWVTPGARAEMLGADFQIISQALRGTTMRLVIPASLAEEPS